MIFGVSLIFLQFCVFFIILFLLGLLLISISLIFAMFFSSHAWFFYSFRFIFYRCLNPMSSLGSTFSHPSCLQLINHMLSAEKKEACIVVELCIFKNLREIVYGNKSYMYVQVLMPCWL